MFYFFLRRRNAYKKEAVGVEQKVHKIKISSVVEKSLKKKTQYVQNFIDNYLKNIAWDVQGLRQTHKLSIYKMDEKKLTH